MSAQSPFVSSSGYTAGGPLAGNGAASSLTGSFYATDENIIAAYKEHLGREPGAAELAKVKKQWQRNGADLGKIKMSQFVRELKESREYQKKVNPAQFEKAVRADYARDAKALKMYDLSVSITGKAPTTGELNNWVRFGSLGEWESSLRDEIKWKRTRGDDGRVTTVKYYSNKALDRLGGDIGKGANAGEIIAFPTSYGAVEGDRWSRGYEHGGWTYQVAQGSYKKGLIGKAFGEGAEKTVAGALPYLQFAGIPVMDSTLSVVFGGEAAADIRFETLEKITGSEKNARRFQKREGVVEGIAASVVDLIAFRGAPVVSSARKVSQAQAADTLGQDVDWSKVAWDVGVSWATYGVTKGLDKYASSAGWGTNWTTYGRPLSQVAIGTAAGVARGQELKDAFASSAVNVAAQQIVPKGANPWAAQAIKVGVPAAYEYSQAKGNKGAELSAVAGAVINYGAGVWQSSDQKTGETITPSSETTASRAASNVLAYDTNKKLAVSPQARGMSHDVSKDFFLAGGSAEDRQSRIALSAQGRY